MHVMDGDCPKSEVIGEKAPELDLSPRTAPIAITGGATATAADTTVSKDGSGALLEHDDADNNNVVKTSPREEDGDEEKIECGGGGESVVSDSDSGVRDMSKERVREKKAAGDMVNGESRCADTDEDVLAEEDGEEMEEDMEIDKSREDDLLEENAEGDRTAEAATAAGSCDEKPASSDDPVFRMDTENGPDANPDGGPTKGGALVPDVKIKESGGAGNNGVCSEDDDRNVTSTHVNTNRTRKRTLADRNDNAEADVDNEVEGEAEGEGSSSESEGGTKRQRVEVEAEDERERLVREYVERCTQSVEEMSRSADKLQKEIGALGELARAKELEWNSILRLRKLKEEMLERLLRRRRQAMMLADNGLTQEWATDYTKHKLNKNSNNQLMMVPVISSSPGNLPPSLSTGINSRPLLSSPDTTRMRIQRPILPKPPLSHSQPNNISHSSNNHSLLFDQQNTIIGEGRQGPILDVKSIIADYRSRHPENVPRRGRRMKSPMVSTTRISGSPALMSMANMALCSGAHIRNTSQDCVSAQDNSRPSSTESTRSAHQTDLPAPGLSFKDVLVQFAKMSQPPPPNPTPIKQTPPPPPPYPEVTLHPVPAPQSPPPTHSSLLHGILTKTTAAAVPSSTSVAGHPNHRPTAFSPTLARLLTAPERERTAPVMSSQFRPPTSRVSISDLLTTSKKTRNEITITPVSSQLPAKSKEEVVLLDDDEETDSTDRLVIDESGDRDREASGNGDVTSEDVPECQGCHQRVAQFVCAGCGNQWYCSRECQVTAWEEHSELCSG